MSRHGSCPACYGVRQWCRRCKTTHCDCSHNNRAQHEKPARPPTKKAFREHLNRLHDDTPNHRHNRYQQRTRPYGDYLYAQDRDKFNVEFAEWAASLLPHHQP